MDVARMRVVILGGGFGGLAAADELRRRLGEAVEITLLDRRPSFRMGFRKIWLLVGRCGPEDGVRRRQELAARGIRFVQAEVVAIDLERRTVRTAEGELAWDYLVVALGAEPRPDLVPGLPETPGAFNLYDAESALAAGEALRRLERGRVLVAVLGLPYKCPPAPYEAALLVDERLRQEGRRAGVALAVTTPQPASLPVAGPAGCEALEGNLALRGIDFLPRRVPRRVRPGAVEFEDGEEPFDLLLAVPPHRPPRVVAESGLVGPGGWVEVDRWTLRTAHPRVFAVGDVTVLPMANGQPLPKAGVFAEAQGRSAASAIAAELAGGEPEPFKGEGACFIELGGGLATLVQGDFLAEPEPRVQVLPPSPVYLEEKRRFEEERLRAWFGA